MLRLTAFERSIYWAGVPRSSSSAAMNCADSFSPTPMISSSNSIHDSKLDCNSMPCASLVFESRFRCRLRISAKRLFRDLHSCSKEAANAAALLGERIAVAS